MFSGVVAQAEAVRQLKADKAPKEEVEKAVKQLLALKVIGNGPKRRSERRPQ